jgi:hypothetical protein
MPKKEYNMKLSIILIMLSLQLFAEDCPEIKVKNPRKILITTSNFSSLSDGEDGKKVINLIGNITLKVNRFINASSTVLPVFYFKKNILKKSDNTKKEEIFTLTLPKEYRNVIDVDKFFNNIVKDKITFSEDDYCFWSNESFELKNIAYALEREDKPDTFDIFLDLTNAHDTTLNENSRQDLIGANQLEDFKFSYESMISKSPASRLRENVFGQCQRYQLANIKTTLVTNNGDLNVEILNKNFLYPYGDLTSALDELRPFKAQLARVKFGITNKFSCSKKRLLENVIDVKVKTETKFDLH